jgi:OOP family OmpA-OmpF porin
VKLLVVALIAAVSLVLPAHAQTAWDLGKQAAGGAAVKQVEKEVNQRLLNESRKNQCSFKTDSDELEPGCDPKAKRLANAIVDAKKRLNGAGVKNFAFEVSGHTDTTGSPSHNKSLSEKRAAAMKRELLKKGLAEGEIQVVGMGSERPLVKPDDTAAKRAKNRRYEVRVRL